MTEIFRGVDIPQNFTREIVRFQNDFELLITKDCPEEISEAVKNYVKESGVDWFQDGFLEKWINPSNRDIFLPRVDRLSGKIVLKKKRPRDGVWPKTKYYTTSTTHEIATSLATRRILANSFADNFNMELADKSGNLYMQETSLSVQIPYGAIIHKSKKDEKYGIFAFVQGESIRNEFEEWGTWNSAPFWLKKLAGSTQRLMNDVARELLKNGVEPWDLGAHQVVYNLDEKLLRLTILDTEEYDFGFNQRFDLESFEFLYPLLVYMYMGI